MQMVEVVIPIGTAVSKEIQLGATKLARHIIKIIDRVENIWDGPGGPIALKNAIQNIIGLARTLTDRWLTLMEEAKTLTKEEQLPTQSPSNVIASVGNGNSNNPVPYTAERISQIIKVHISQILSQQGTGGIRLCCIEKARTMLNLALQRVKNHYDCEEGIAHSDVAHF